MDTANDNIMDYMAAKFGPIAPSVIQLRKNQNALRPSGPKTDDGKVASSRNSLNHGLTAKQTVIPGEDAAEFDQLCAGLIEDRKPTGELEIQLTGEIAACMWRLARARRHEADFLERAVDLYGKAAARLELIIRYAGSIERQLNRAIVRLEQCQTARRKLPVPLPSAPEPKPKTMAAGASNVFSYNDLPPAAEFVSSSGNPPPTCSQRDPSILVSGM